MTCSVWDGGEQPVHSCSVLSDGPELLNEFCRVGNYSEVVFNTGGGGGVGGVSCLTSCHVGDEIVRGSVKDRVKSCRYVSDNPVNVFTLRPGYILSFLKTSILHMQYWYETGVLWWYTLLLWNDAMVLLVCFVSSHKTRPNMKLYLILYICMVFQMVFILINLENMFETDLSTVAPQPIYLFIIK